MDRLPSFQRFATGDPADIVVHVRGIAHGSRNPDGWRVRDLQLSESGRTLRLDCSEWLADLDLACGTVTATLSADRGLALDSLLKTVAQLVVLDNRSALVMHASAVERHGEAFVFCGRSGAGKTTAAFLSRDAGARVLAEDMVCVGGLDRDVAPELLTLPFWQTAGTVTVPERLPVRRIFALEQAPVDAVAPLAYGAQVRVLSSAASIGVRARPFMEAALDLSCRLAERVPVKLLRFRKSPDFWSAIDDDLKGDAHGVG
jgi:hypothetical protein